MSRSCTINIQRKNFIHRLKPFAVLRTSVYLTLDKIGEENKFKCAVMFPKANIAHNRFLECKYISVQMSRQFRSKQTAATMTFAIQILAFLLLAVLPFAVLKVDALNYVIVDSGDGNFQLKWAYNNGKLMFNMTCKTTGWCALAFTTNHGGRSMVNYDIALGGVASGTEYLDVSISLFFFKEVV